MPRKPRAISESGCYHFITRGVSKKQIFHREKDYNFYLRLLYENKQLFRITIYHYCLMTNHTHILLRSKDKNTLSRFGHYVQRRYAYYYCRTHKWRGQVFQNRFVSIPIEKDSYLLECGRYIERNPLRAGIVKSLKAYPWSSYNFYAGNKQDHLLEPSPMFLDLGDSKNQQQALYKEYLNISRPYEELVDQALIKS